MKIKTAELVTSAPTLEHAPESDLPELALLGRSNVGKSSFLNSLLGRKNLARVSQTPGKTRLLNFFRVNDRWVIVDMPGYGYAKVSKTEQERWRREMTRFLQERENLRAAIQLIDIRHGPQPNDLQMIEWLRAIELDPVFVLTKSDKLSRPQQQKSLAATARLLEVPREQVIPYSSVTHEGRDQVLKVIQARLAIA